jgi:LPXTG-site transpeptidase (sortase) family protein
MKIISALFIAGIILFSPYYVKASELPVRLRIPSISVNAFIEYAGLTSQGAIDAPKGPVNVAWFNLGPRPGDIGSAIIDGHYGLWKNGGGSVFDNLNKLKTGDKIYVEGKNGMMVAFVVKKLKIYGRNEYAPEVFNSSDGNAHLNIITCAGDWLMAQKTYSNRLVAFTDRE